MHPFFHLLGLSIPAYWAFGMAGLIAAVLFVLWNNRTYRLPGADLLHLIVLAPVGAIVGAKLLYVATVLPLIVRNAGRIAGSPVLLLQLLQNGYVFYGGFLGAAAMVLWYCRKYRLPAATAVALMTPAVPLFHAFGRIGCFFAGCCWGKEVPWGIAFTKSLGAPNGVPLLPVQLIESALNLLLFFLLVVLGKRLKEKWRLLLYYILFYGAIRFVLEFFRGDKLRGVLLLSTSQWISLVLIAVSVGMLTELIRLPKRPHG